MSTQAGIHHFPEPQTPEGVAPALIDAAQTFAAYSLGSGSPSTRRPMNDTTLFSQWSSYARERNLDIHQRHPQRPEPLAMSTLPIRIFLCPPVSNVSAEEKEELDGQLNALTSSLKEFGNQVEIESPKLLSAGRQDHAPEIYLGRACALQRTDLVIAFLDPASTGVGIMLQLIHNATIPCLCVTKHSAALSRMVRGLSPSRLPFVECSSTVTIGAQVADWLTQHIDEIRQSRARREDAWLRLAGLNFRRGITLAQLVSAPENAMPLFRSEFTERLQACDDLVGTPTLFQLAYIAIAQQWHLVPSSSGFLALEPSFDLPDSIRNREMAEAAARVSLSNLYDAMQQMQVDQSKAERAWCIYVEELSLNAARKERKVKAIADLSRSVSDWLSILSAKDEL
jgi:hypothetical protein